MNVRHVIWLVSSVHVNYMNRADQWYFMLVIILKGILVLYFILQFRSPWQCMRVIDLFIEYFTCTLSLIYNSFFSPKILSLLRQPNPSPSLTKTYEKQLIYADDNMSIFKTNPISCIILPQYQCFKRYLFTISRFSNMPEFTGYCWSLPDELAWGVRSLANSESCCDKQK